MSELMLVFILVGFAVWTGVGIIPLIAISVDRNPNIKQEMLLTAILTGPFGLILMCIDRLVIRPICRFVMKIYDLLED